MLKHFQYEQYQKYPHSKCVLYSVVTKKQFLTEKIHFLKQASLCSKIYKNISTKVNAPYVRKYRDYRQINKIWSGWISFILLTKALKPLMKAKPFLIYVKNLKPL